ncbi:MAG: hypothetical protein IJE10_09125 [Clostridia bacterium]|nr:hypothetical protein [Clostridia bacterium]
MSGQFTDREDFFKDVRMRMIKYYIEDYVQNTMMRMDFEEVLNNSFDKFFKTLEKIIHSEKLDDSTKVEKILKLIQKYQLTLD